MKTLLSLLVSLGMLATYTAVCFVVGYVIGGDSVVAKANACVVGLVAVFVASWLVRRNDQP
jgi:preprotein translocase subunit SecF